MKLARIVLLLFLPLTAAAQDLSVPKTIDPPRQAQAAPQVQCIPEAGKPEPYYLERNVHIDIWRYFTRRPENNCAEDTVGEITKPTYSSERKTDNNGAPYIAQTWQFSETQSIDILQGMDANSFPDVQKTLDLNELIHLIVGSREDNGDKDVSHVFDTYSPWEIESDRTFDYGGTNWLHAREVVFVRKPPPPPPSSQQDGGAHYRIIEDPIYLRIRKVVDSCNQQTYVLSDTGGSDYWFDSLSVHCDDLSKRSDNSD
jgi:hypothetical protein